MSDLFGNHIVGFPTRQLIFSYRGCHVSRMYHVANRTFFFLFLSHLLIAGCDTGVQISIRSFVCPSTFTSKFSFLDIRELAESLKPCIVIFPDIPFKHAP